VDLTPSNPDLTSSMSALSYSSRPPYMRGATELLMLEMADPMARAIMSIIVLSLFFLSWESR